MADLPEGDELSKRLFPRPEATLFTSELRYWLNPHWTVFALYDWAKGRRERSTDPVNFSSNDIQLRGSGLGVAVTYPDIATVKASNVTILQTAAGHVQVRFNCPRPSPHIVYRPFFYYSSASFWLGHCDVHRAILLLLLFFAACGLTLLPPPLFVRDRLRPM